MSDKVSQRLAARSAAPLPRDVAGHTIAADDFTEDDDYTEQVLENDAKMIAFLSCRRRDPKAENA